VKSQMTALCGEIKAVLQHLEEAQLPRRISDAATPPDETHRGQGTSGAHPSEEGDPGRCAVRPPRHE